MDQVTARQQEIIAAALAIISERGLESLTVKNIADRVGFSDAAIYRHFKNKYAILSAMVDGFADSSIQELGRINTGGISALAQIKQFFLNRCRAFASDRALATVMFSENLFQNDPQLAAKVHRVLSSHREQLLKIIQNGQQQKTIRLLPAGHLFTMIMGSLRLLVLQWQVSGYDFDLIQAGEKLWISLETLIKKPQGD